MSGLIASDSTSLTEPFVIEFMDREMVEILRSKTTTEKIAMLGAAHRTAKKLVACGIRGMHPDWSDEQVQAEVTRRMFRGTT
jgi:hypothetical protein